MGFSASWCAVRGASREDVLAAFNWETSGKRDPYPDFPICLAELPNGWLLIWHDDLEAAFKSAVKLSRHGPAVACAVEEHVMYSEARGYAQGAEAWRVMHDPDKGESLYHLETTGTPPPQLAKIHADLKAEQDGNDGEDADVDFIFDVPAKLTTSICGFSYDEVPPEGMVFEELRRAKAGGSAGPGFFARLFGAR